MRIKDIRFTEEALQDWVKLPGHIKGILDNKLKAILDSGKLPNSLNAHKDKIHVEDGFWIGHITQGRGSYRIVFDVDANGTMTVYLVGNHRAMEKFFLAYT